MTKTLLSLAAATLLYAAPAAAQDVRVPVGDLASAGDTDIVVELVAADGATTTTVDREQFRALRLARPEQDRDAVDRRRVVHVGPPNPAA